MTMQTVTMAKADDGSKVVEDVIWIDPERQGGEPCFINTRVPIKILFDYLAGGDPLDEFLEGFPPVTREQAEKVLARLYPFSEVRKTWFYKPFAFHTGVCKRRVFQPPCENSARLRQL